MIQITEKSKCNGCYACTNTCPKNCIKMVSDNEGFWYPLVDKDKCIDCGMCEKVCPIIHKWHPDEIRKTTALAAINLNEKIRLKSSSGGIFTLIAEKIISQGGVVFGAAFANDFKSVHHICVDNVTDLEKLRGSKYVQSMIGDAYKQAKYFLENGRKVLFTGTPCQIGGLYSYLQKPYDTLYTQDIICHGVPSPMVWEKYVEERERKSNSQTQRMFFRHKKYGWKTYAVLFEFSNNTAYVKNLREDSFMRAFLSNACLRPSCYNCSFKSIKRQADITLADFWGIQNVLPEMDDDKGTSLVLIHSEKVQKLMESIQSISHTECVSEEVVTKFNSAAIQSAKMGEYRDIYMRRIVSESPDELAKIYFKVPLKRRIVFILSKIGLMKVIKRLRSK